MKTLEQYALNVRIDVKVDADDIQGLLESALDGSVHGASYWCRLTESNAEKSSEQMVFQLVGGGLVLVESPDGEDVQNHTLTLKKLKRGFAMWFTNGHATHSYMKGTKDDGTLDLDIDGPQADVILQYALLGEQRYG